MNIINEDYLVESIIGQSRHQFIYGNDEIVRTRILKYVTLACRKL